MRKEVKIDIKYTSSLDEYCVRYLENGIKNEDKSYYTDDKEDAKATMQAMINEFED